MMEIMVVLGGLALIAFWLAIIVRWRLGFIGLLVFLPYAGALSLKLHSLKEMLLLKDFLFVLPAYASFFFFHRKDLKLAPIPRPVLMAIGFLGLLVVLQSMNPHIDQWLVPAIGIKIWLFYVPLAFLSAAYVNSHEDLSRLLRILILVSIIPCAVGLLQWFGAMTYGYEETMESFYGDAAKGATQNFGFHVYGGKLFRIPATFTFVSQYFGYTMGMVVFGYCMMRFDVSRTWRHIGLAMIGLYIVSGVLSGARGGLVFIPLLLVVTAFLDQRLTGIIGIVVALPVLVLTALNLGGLDPMIIFGATGNLVTDYSKDLVMGHVVEAFRRYPFGMGTGMNTGAARHAYSSESQAFTALPFLVETYYAKAIVELGFLGLIAVCAMFFAIIAKGFTVLRSIKDRSLRSCAAAFLAFFIVIAIHSGKGWQIDYDPLNIYLWVFVGLMFKLPALDAIAPRQAVRARPVPRRPQRRMTFPVTR